MNLERGTLLHGRYRILDVLGEGGMGAVYRAVDENLGVEVAVKENFFASEDYTRQFHREATILASLRHSNLPRVTDHFSIENQGQYLVMDFIEGEDLRERMDRVDLLSEDEVIVLGISICEALSYMHSRTQPVLHRDIKPGNVKITPEGDVVLVDFGLAKIVEGDGETTPGARAMTPGYSPPEQYGTARTDPRSDIYSLSATIYEALTGTVPEDALSRLMEQARLTPVRALKPSISRKMAGVLERGLEIRPEDRYQSADEFRQALVNVTRGSARRRVEGGELTLQPPPNYQDLNTAIPRLESDAPNSSGEVPIPVSRELAFGDPGGLPRRRRRSGYFVLAILLGLIIGACGGVYFFYPDVGSQAIGALIPSGPIGIAVINSPTPTSDTQTVSTPAPSAVLPTATATLKPLPLATATPTLIEENLANPEEELLQVSRATSTHTPVPTATPLGGGSGQLAFASDRSGIPQIWLTNLDGTNLVQLTDIQEGACQPSWSPNGNELVFISPCEGHREGYNNASMFLINSDGTDLRPLPTILGGDYDPAWSPNGDVIAFTSLRREGRPQIFFLNLEDQSFEPLTDEITNDFMPSWSSDGEQVLFITTRRGPFQIWVSEPGGRIQELYSRSGGEKNTVPRWSPDQQVIIFNRVKQEPGVPTLMGTRVENETYEEFLIFSNWVPSRDASFSPDGVWIAFESWPDGQNHDIYMMTPNGVGLERITDSLANDFDPAWRPPSADGS